MRSSGLFDYKTNCIFCSCPDPYDGKKSEFRLIPARTLELRETILQACERYHNEWVNTANPHLPFVSDLPATDVVYHKQCSVNFNPGKRMPHTFACRQSDDPSAAKYQRVSGRPKDEVKSAFFLQVTRYLEQNDNEQITIHDLINHMRSVIVEMGNQMLLHSTVQRPGFCMTHSQKHKDPEQEKAQIIKTAAQLFKNDIKTIKQSKDVYPSNAEMASSEAPLVYIPDCLKTFLKIVFAGKDVDVKLVSIGQAILQAARPRVLMAPLQIGLGVQLHHHFQSKFLIESLNSHGFCCSYDEVKRYERCASITKHEIPKTMVLIISRNMQLTMLTITSEPQMARTSFTEWASSQFSHQGSTSTQGSDEQI